MNNEITFATLVNDLRSRDKTREYPIDTLQKMYTLVSVADSEEFTVPDLFTSVYELVSALVSDKSFRKNDHTVFAFYILVHVLSRLWKIYPSWYVPNVSLSIRNITAVSVAAYSGIYNPNVQALLTTLLTNHEYNMWYPHLRDLRDVLARVVIAGMARSDAGTAAFQGNLQIFDALLNGQNVNKTSVIFTETLLMLAVSYQSEQCVKYLVEHGADVGIRESDGTTVVDELNRYPIADKRKAERILNLLVSAHHDPEDADTEYGESDEDPDTETKRVQRGKKRESQASDQQPRAKKRHVERLWNEAWLQELEASCGFACEETLEEADGEEESKSESAYVTTTVSSSPLVERIRRYFEQPREYTDAERQRLVNRTVQEIINEFKNCVDHDEGTGDENLNRKFSDNDTDCIDIQVIKQGNIWKIKGALLEYPDIRKFLPPLTGTSTYDVTKRVYAYRYPSPVVRRTLLSLHKCVQRLNAEIRGYNVTEYIPALAGNKEYGILQWDVPVVLGSWVVQLTNPQEQWDILHNPRITPEGNIFYGVDAAPLTMYFWCILYLIEHAPPESGAWTSIVMPDYNLVRELGLTVDHILFSSADTLDETDANNIMLNLQMRSVNETTKNNIQRFVSSDDKRVMLVVYHTHTYLLYKIWGELVVSTTGYLNDIEALRELLHSITQRTVHTVTQRDQGDEGSCLVHALCRTIAFVTGVAYNAASVPNNIILVTHRLIQFWRKAVALRSPKVTRECMTKGNAKYYDMWPTYGVNRWTPIRPKVQILSLVEDGVPASGAGTR